MIFDLNNGEFPEEQELWMPEMSAELREELFSLAHEVRKNEPWKEFCDQDWYGVRDPETGELQIVSILGMGRQVFAVQLYRPDEGIRFWNELMETGELNQRTVLFDLRMVECEFCAKGALPEEDLEWNELHPPKGKRKRKAGYVSFRSHQPAHYPWFIEEDEGRMLANAMRLLPVFGDFTDDVDVGIDLFTGQEKMPQIPIFELKKGGDPRKTDDWKGSVGAFPVAPPRDVDVPRDDLFHARMTKLRPKQGTRWEIGSFYIPGPTQIGDRLVYPMLTVTAPLESEELPMPQIGSSAVCRADTLRKSFAARTGETGYLPETLVVASQIAENAFRDLAEACDFELVRVPRLPTVAPMVSRLMDGLSESGILEGETDEPEDDGIDEYREPTCPARFVMRVDLVGAKPPIWRRISMPADASFFDLHVAIQEAMGWHNCHLHNFELREGKRPVATIELAADEDDFMPFGRRCESLPELGTTLYEVVERGYRKIYYCYDFGDGWEHRIQIEDVVDPKVLNPLPELLKGRGACPPEDCGGLWGYYALLEGDPDYTEGWDSKELKKIQEAEFDPKAVVFTSGRQVYERWKEMRDLM